MCVRVRVCVYDGTLDDLLLCAGFPEAKLAGAKAGFAAAGFDCWETTIGSRGVWLHYHTPNNV